MTTKRISLVNSFYRYKTSLKFHGEFKKEHITIYDGERVKFFFADNYAEVEKVLSAVANRPRVFANMLAEQSSRKLNPESELSQNLLYGLFPCYLPSMIKEGQVNNGLVFMR